MKRQVASPLPEAVHLRSAPWRAVAFDLDDTLYPEIEFVRSGFREVAAWSAWRLGFDAEKTLAELFGLFEGGVRGALFDSWIGDHGLPTSLIDEMVKTYREHYPRIQPFHGVKELLTELNSRFRLGLLSDGLLAVQERKLEALGIGGHFDAVIFSDRWGRDSWKPSSRPFLALVDALGVKPEEAVYVGDNPAKDFIACRRLGMQSIWLRQSSGIYADLGPDSDAGRPDYVIESIAGIRALLGGVRDGSDEGAPGSSLDCGV